MAKARAPRDVVKAWQEAINEGVAPDDFATLLENLGLNQRQFARLGRFGPGSVNRWCSVTRKDSLNPPSYVLVIAMLYSMLTPEARERLKEAINGD